MASREDKMWQDKLPGWRRKENFLGFFLITPALIILFSVIIYPLLLNLIMSFQKILMMKPYLGTPFTGFDNYINTLEDPIFWRALRNTFIWTVSCVVLQISLGLGAALLLNAPIKGRGLFRGAMLIPWVTPGVVAALTWRWMYDGQFGIFNHILMKIGLIKQPIVWLGNYSTALPAVIAEYSWKMFPFATVMLLAALQTIPKELYEAAEVDGATGWQSFRHITLPEIMPTLSLTTLLTSIWTFNNFDSIWLLTEGGPSYASETLTTYVYKAAFQAFNLGKASSIAFIMFMLLFGLVLIYARALRRGKE
ncbi:MAG: carbohydrate ABC transporter permease [Zhaonellaceae bacterium]|jgi:multiple sugar transport system permease protein|nr:sugar ABC transporter permease [Clostridia bacterium]